MKAESGAPSRIASLAAVTDALSGKAKKEASHDPTTVERVSKHDYKLTLAMAKRALQPRLDREAEDGCDS